MEQILHCILWLERGVVGQLLPHLSLRASVHRGSVFLVGLCGVNNHLLPSYHGGRIDLRPMLWSFLHPSVNHTPGIAFHPQVISKILYFYGFANVTVGLNRYPDRRQIDWAASWVTDANRGLTSWCGIMVIDRTFCTCSMVPADFSRTPMLSLISVRFLYRPAIPRGSPFYAGSLRHHVESAAAAQRTDELPLKITSLWQLFLYSGGETHG